MSSLEAKTTTKDRKTKTTSRLKTKTKDRKTKTTNVKKLLLVVVLSCSRAGCLLATQPAASCCVEYQLWISLMTWVNNWSRVRLVWSTTHKDLESPVTWLQIDVFVLTSTLDSNWMDSHSTTTSALSIQTSRCSLQFRLSSHVSPTCSRSTPTMIVLLTYR